MCLALVAGPCVPWPCGVTGLSVTSLPSLRPYHHPRKEVGAFLCPRPGGCPCFPQMPPQVAASVKPAPGS